MTTDTTPTPREPKSLRELAQSAIAAQRRVSIIPSDYSTAEYEEAYYDLRQASAALFAALGEQEQRRCDTCIYAHPYGDPYESWLECTQAKSSTAKCIPVCEEIGTTHLLVRPDFSCPQWWPRAGKDGPQ